MIDKPMANIIAVVAVFEIHAEMAAVTAPNAHKKTRKIGAATYATHALTAAAGWQDFILISRGSEIFIRRGCLHP